MSNPAAVSVQTGSWLDLHMVKLISDECALQGKGGKRQLLSANAGDARVILARGSDGVQLSEDHVPDVEEERKRIERWAAHCDAAEPEGKRGDEASMTLWLTRIRIMPCRTNPNPKMPLVRFVGNTWRVGGVLALSRAFGDAYLKGSAQFEGGMPMQASEHEVSGC